MKSKYVQYYVEGEDEEKVIDVLKSKLRVIKAGKVQVLNVVDREISDMRLRTLNMGTMVVLVFDTDTGSVDVLRKNIGILQKCPSVSEVVLVPQVANLEDELVRSCNIKKVEELLNSESKAKFKSELIRISNLDKKLKEHRFDINKFWSGTPSSVYSGIKNQAEKIKILK